MATSSFKSTSKRPTSSTTPTQPHKDKGQAHGPGPPPRSRSVSAFPRTHLNNSPFEFEFHNTTDNPLFWVDGSSNFDDFEGVAKLSGSCNGVIDGSGGIGGGGEARRGRFVYRNAGGGGGGGESRGRSVVRNASGGGVRKDIGRSLSRVDTGQRRRSPSRGHYGTSKNGREQESELLKFRSNLSSNGKRSSLEGKSKLVRSASDLSEVLKGHNTWSSQHPAFDTYGDSSLSQSASRIPHWDDGISTNLFSEAEEKTIEPVSVQKISPLKDINGTPGVIRETVRSEVRQAISDLQYDLKNVMLNGGSDVQRSNTSDVPELGFPNTVGLVRDMQEEFSKELQECEERTRKLRAELAAEEHREIELNKILHDIVPEPKTPLVQNSRTVRKASFERKKMSKRLEEEALAFFDECVSISTFEDSDFSSLEDLPFNMVNIDGLDSGRVSLPDVPNGASVASSFRSQDDVRRTEVVHHHKGSNTLDTPSLEEDIRNYLKVFSKDNGRERSNAHIIDTSLQSSRNYICEVPEEKALLDRLIFKSRIESGSMLLCDSSLRLSVAPFSSVLR